MGGFDIEVGTTTVLILDFDAAKSVVLTGEGEVLFKPVVKLLKRERGIGQGGRPVVLGGQGQGPDGQGRQGQGRGGAQHPWDRPRN